MGWDLIGSAQMSVENAIDASKILLERDDSNQGEQSHLIISRLHEQLVEAKSMLAGVRAERAELYDEIRSLSESIRVHGTVVKHQDAYYVKSEDGKTLGDPYCLACWEVRRMLFHLVRKESRVTVCCDCGHDYNAEYTPFQVAA